MKKHREYTVVIEQDEVGYSVAEVPALKSCYTLYSLRLTASRL